ncbi:MAG: AMP-binding protein [Chitinophagales bacterium]
MMLIDFSSETPIISGAVESMQEVLTWLQEWLDDRPSYQLQTSGSTGNPKIITHQRNAFLNSASRTNTFFGITSHSNMLLALPVKGIGGKMMLVRAAVAGCKLWCVPPTSNPLKEILQQPFDLASFTPMQLQLMLKEEQSKAQLLQIKNLLIGGSTVSARLENNWVHLGSKSNCYETFGMTETLSHVALRAFGNNYFTALPGVTFSERDGCLEINDQYVLKKTIVTNDLVELLSPSAFQWLGRTDFAINTGGLKVHPELIEKKLLDVITTPFFFWKQKDELLGEKVIAVVNGQPDSVMEQELKVTPLLSKYEHPKAVYFLPKFLYTATGKIDRLATAALISE